MSGLTAEQRAYLRAEIDRRRRIVVCPGCGKEIPRTSERRRYCERACANRHWHIRKAALSPTTGGRPSVPSP